MSNRPIIALVSADPDRLKQAWYLALQDQPSMTVGEFLARHPAMSATELTAVHLDLPIGRVALEVRAAAEEERAYLPPGVSPEALSASPPDELAREPGQASATGRGEGREGAGGSEPSAHGRSPLTRMPPVRSGHPEQLSEREAALRAYDADITAAASYLNNGLSVLLRCEKLLVEHLATEVAFRAHRPQHVVRVGPAAAGAGAPVGGVTAGGGRRSALLGELQAQMDKAPAGDVVVVPHLDLLAGGSDAALSSEAREVTDLFYEKSDTVLLAFVDPSMAVPEVLANRFAVRLAIDILPREIQADDGAAVPIGRALVTREEAELFAGFDADELYKHVAGMNAVRLRHALRYAAQQYRPGAVDQPDRDPPAFGSLLHELRVFKAKTSATAFDVPNVPFDAIGGYDNVKAELQQALDIVSGSVELPEDLRHDLVPRGFVLHGPPGTGKTLFAKAIATRLRGTIQVVSGPEITDMYVGESERKIRELFAEARRNAPAVLVFDEFDSIAGQRSGRDDGGSRAGNAIVAQLLTELDGFRPEVPVIIVGTTNRIDLIDVALLRPSRFRPIKIDLPNGEARREIARWHARHFGIPVSEELLASMARATEGLNGDEIRSVFRDARADQLVGPHRGQEVRPARLGELVGQLLRTRQQQDIDRANATPGRGQAAGRSHRVLVTLTPGHTDGEARATSGSVGQEPWPEAEVASL